MDKIFHFHRRWYVLSSQVSEVFFYFLIRNPWSFDFSFYCFLLLLRFLPFRYWKLDLWYKILQNVSLPHCFFFSFGLKQKVDLCSVPICMCQIKMFFNTFFHKMSTLIISQSEDLLCLGGCRQKGNFSLTNTMEDTEGIMERCTQLCPALKVNTDISKYILSQIQFSCCLVFFFVYITTFMYHWKFTIIPTNIELKFLQYTLD